MTTVKDFGGTPSGVADLLYVAPPELALEVEESIFSRHYRDKFEAMLTAEWDAFSQLPVAVLFMVVDDYAEDEGDDEEEPTLMGFLDSSREGFLEEGGTQAKWDAIMAFDAARADAVFRMTDGPYVMLLELDEHRLSTLPIGFLRTLADAYGMFLDEKRVTDALDGIFARLDAGEIADEQEALEAALKVALDTDMLVDP